MSCCGLDSGAAAPAGPDGDGLVADRIDLGPLTCEISPRLVSEVIDITGRREQRRRQLPAVAVLFFVLALCLFSGADSRVPPGYRSVWRSLTRRLRPAAGEPGRPGAGQGRAIPTSAALSRARQRLGVKPVELLFDRVRGPRATSDTPGAFALGRRLVCWDGTTLDLAPSQANIARFGVPARGGDPQVRLLTITECGTRAVIDAAFDGINRASEQVLARQVLAGLGPDMLLLADRNFPGHTLWGLAQATGAALLWRIKTMVDLPPTRVLPDGSYHAILRSPQGNKRHNQARYAGRRPRPQPGHLIRVVNYRITVHTDDGHPRTERYRLITTLLDHDHAPAADLARLYHERWESETSNHEVKTVLRGSGFLLRSRLAELVEQELLALLTVHHLLSGLRHHAAAAAGLDPDRISFTITVRTTRDHLGSGIPAHQTRCDTIADLLADPLAPRRNRQYERIKKPPKNTYPTKRHDQPRPPDRVTHHITVTRPRPAPTP